MVLAVPTFADTLANYTLTGPGNSNIATLSGDGEIYSFSLLWHPRSPRFEYPVIAILVDLAEGIRVVSNLVGADPGQVRIGMPVTVEFQPCEGELAVPVFRPRTEAS